MIDFNCRNNYGGNAYDKDELKWRSDKVLEDLSANKTNYFYLGAHLIDIWNTRCYGAHTFDTLSNYSGKNFFDYCYVTFGLGKSQVSRYMNIVDEFGDGLRGFKSEYKDYSYSLLSEMLSLSPAERKKVKPDWTIKQVREYKKELSGTVATSQQAEKVKVTKLYGDLRCSDYYKKYINKFAFKTDCESLMNPPKELLDDIFEFCKSAIAGFDFSGYGIKNKDRINVIYGLIAFALDVGQQISSSVDKNYSAFGNICHMVPVLRKLGYMPGGTND